MGIVGAALVAIWAQGLLRETGRVLLDAEMDAPVVDEIQEVLRQNQAVQITDLHVWRVGKGNYACIVSLATSSPIPADQIRQQLSIHDELFHLPVEINKPTNRRE